MKNSFYITTTLPYVNADPHVGFAMEIVHADTIARYKRLLGYEVFFNTGTDEHGQKIFQKATEEGRNVEEYVNSYAEKFRDLKEVFNLSIDRFVRTTDPDHVNAAQELWNRCKAGGDIEKKKYKGLYCVGDEVFLKESDLVDGKCPNHPSMVPVEIEEENYYFKLSKYQNKILDYLKNENVILPDWRRQEAINFVANGLEDFSISRLKSKMSWGVPVPGDDEHVMYVWFDALTNYISTLGWPEDKEGNFKKFWENGEVVQTAGKDQVRFQSIMWQGMLMSAGIKNTDKVVYHGFINSGGHKMSKSLGNVLSPSEIITEFKPYAGELATDVLRYFLLRHVNSFDDSDMTLETVIEAYNANLANGLGNLVSRIMTMAVNSGVKLSTEDLSTRYYTDEIEELNNYDFNEFMNTIWANFSSLDEYIQNNQPFKKIKINKEEAEKDLRYLLLHLYGGALALEAVLPETSKKIQELIKENKKPEKPLFLRKD